MSFCLLSPEVLRVGEPTPFALRDKTGCLLIPRGVMVATEAQRAQMISRELYVETHEGELVKRALAGKVHSMVQRNDRLGHIADARTNGTDIANAQHTPVAGRRLEDPKAAWVTYVLRASAVLRDTAQDDFEGKLLRLQTQLLELLNTDADNALLVLVHAAANDFRDYSATHATLVAVVCELAARQLPAWTAEMRLALRCAALTMNVGMMTLQNMLATQDDAPNVRQRAEIDDHAARGAAALRAAGIKQPLWLGAVEQHHSAAPGPLATLPPETQLARLIQRADIFAARLSPRKRRAAMSGNSAAKAAFLDENGQPDEAGMALVKSVGIYPPGSLVRLTNGEVAVVLQRGLRANQPVVACVVSPSGMPLAMPSLRDTRRRGLEVTGGVAPHEVKVLLNVEKLLKMA